MGSMAQLDNQNLVSQRSRVRLKQFLAVLVFSCVYQEFK